MPFNGSQKGHKELPAQDWGYSPHFPVPSVEKTGPRRIHALFSGTALIQTTAPERPKASTKKASEDPTCPPDDGTLVPLVVEQGQIFARMSHVGSL